MGEIKRGILGGFSGRVGTVVGSTWKKVSYMRALALSVANPRTLPQQEQRTRFALTLAFLRTLTPYLRVGYKPQTQTRTAFNAAMSYNIRYALTGEFPDIGVDYRRVMVARGSLTPVFDVTVTKEDGKIAMAWTDNSGMGDAFATDLAMPLAYNKKRSLAVYDFAAATRGDAALELALPADWGDDPVAVYLAFRSEDNRTVTNSICLLDEPYEGEDAGGGTGGNTGGTGGAGGDGNQGANPLG